MTKLNRREFIHRSIKAGLVSASALVCEDTSYGSSWLE